jgi:hypothetical protein
MFSYIFYY